MSDTDANRGKRSPTLTVGMPEDLQERVRDAAYWSRLAVSELVQDAVQVHLRKLEIDHNGGRPFEARRSKLKSTGRPPKQ